MIHTSVVEIGKLVPEKKIFGGFLSYMGVAAVFVMWPRCRKQTFVGGDTQILALNSQAIWAKMFEIVNGRGTEGRRTHL